MFKLLAVTLALQVAYSHGFAVEPRIMNGHLTDPKQVPFYVFIHSISNTSMYMCGGSYLGNGYIHLRIDFLTPDFANNLLDIFLHLDGL